MAEYLIQDTTLTSIADEIRTLSGTEETLSPEAMKEKVAEANENIVAEADLIAQIQTTLEGKSNIENNLLTREITTYSNNNITSIGEYAFAGCSNLTELYLTNSSFCSLIDSTAFSNTLYQADIYPPPRGVCIFIPSILYTTYTTDSIWKALKYYFVKIEDKDEIIYFFINSTHPYRAKKNTTWNDYCANSDYFFSQNFFISDGFIINMMNCKLMDETGEYVTADSIIIENTNYQFEQYSTGGVVVNESITN